MGSHARVLLVDDDPDTLKITALLLRKHGYQAFTVQDPEQALPTAREIQPDLILLDRSMGRIDGLEVCRQIKNDPQMEGILVVYLSANIITSDQQALGLEAGADGYITRPISNRELLARVQAFVRVKRAEDNLRLSEAKFRTVIEQAGEGIVLIDDAGCIAEWNREMENISGLARSEVIAQPISKMQDRMPSAEDRERLNGLPQRTLADGLSVLGRDELTVTLEDGLTRVIETSASTLRAAGRSYIGVIVRDVTERKRAEAERERLITDLQQAVAEVKTLSGLLPICAACKRIRNDQGYWERLEKYIQEHSDAKFTHSICPQCARRLYPELYD